MLGLFGMLGLVTVSFTKILVQGTKLCVKLMWYLFTWPFYLLGWFLKNKTSASVEFYNLNGKKIKDMNGLEYEHAAAKWLVTQGYHSVAVHRLLMTLVRTLPPKTKTGKFGYSSVNTIQLCLTTNRFKKLWHQRLITVPFMLVLLLILVSPKRRSCWPQRIMSN